MTARLETPPPDIGTIPGLQAALDGKASPADIDAAISGLVSGAPANLDTLNELAVQLSNDESAASALTNAVAQKQALAEKGQANGYAGLDANQRVAQDPKDQSVKIRHMTHSARPPWGYRYPNAVAQTFPRLACNTTSGFSTGQMRCAPITLPGGEAFTRIVFHTSTQAPTGVSHVWYALMDRQYNVLATTPDDGATGWPASRSKALPLATAIGGSNPGGSFTAPDDGDYILGCVLVGSIGTMAAIGGGEGAFVDDPLPCANILAGLTGPSSLPANPLVAGDPAPSNTTPWAAVLA